MFGSGFGSGFGGGWRALAGYIRKNMAMPVRVMMVPKSSRTETFCCGLSSKAGIRILEVLLMLTRFLGGSLQPLEHLSVDWILFHEKRI